MDSFLVFYQTSNALRCRIFAISLSTSTNIKDSHRQVIWKEIPTQVSKKVLTNIKSANGMFWLTMILKSNHSNTVSGILLTVSFVHHLSLKRQISKFIKKSTPKEISSVNFVHLHSLHSLLVNYTWKPTPKGTVSSVSFVHLLTLKRSVSIFT